MEEWVVGCIEEKDGRLFMYLHGTYLYMCGHPDKSVKLSGEENGADQKFIPD